MYINKPIINKPIVLGSHWETAEMVISYSTLYDRLRNKFMKFNIILSWSSFKVHFWSISIKQRTWRSVDSDSQDGRLDKKCRIGWPDRKCRTSWANMSESVSSIISTSVLGGGISGAIVHITLDNRAGQPRCDCEINCIRCTWKNWRKYQTRIPFIVLFRDWFSIQCHLP